MKLALTEELWREGNMYVTYCPELDIPAVGVFRFIQEEESGER